MRFAYGHEQVLAALDSSAEYARHRREHGEKAARETELGQAISYRFKRNDKGWRVFATTEMMDVPAVTDQRRGAIGVDLNADHLAVCETDASGNYVNAFGVPLVTYGKSQHQAEAIIGDAVAGVVAYARVAGKLIVIERLDFRQKKPVLEGREPQVQPDAVQFQLWQGQGLLPVSGLPGRSGDTSGEPGLQFGDWPGQVHAALRAQRSPGGCLCWPVVCSAVPSASPADGLPPSAMASMSPSRTCKEASEARVDVLGCGSGAVETGACSATPAGEACARTQSGSGSGLTGSVRCSRVRSRAEPP